MLKRRVLGLAVVVVAAIAVVVIVLATTPVVDSPQPAEVELQNHYTSSPTTLSFRYPAQWRYTIPTLGLMVITPVEGDGSSNLTILRSSRLHGEVDTLADALDLYLRRGPMLPDQAWEIVNEIRPAQIDQREALAVDLEGANVAGDPEQHIQVLLTRADNGLFYVFAAGAPLGEWPDLAATYAAMLASVDIVE